MNTTSDGSATVEMDLQVLNIHVACLPATNVTPVTQGADNSYQFSASLSPSCIETFGGHSFGYPYWSGSMGTAYPACIPLINSTAPPFVNLTTPIAPISMGFSVNQTTASAVFCYGYQRVFNATATFDLRLRRVATKLSNLNYVAGHPLEQYVRNG